MEENETTLKQKLENLAEHATNLAETGYKLAIVEVTEKTSKMISNTILITIILFLINVLFLFIGFGLAYFISELTGNLKSGFFIVGGIYLLLILLLLSMRKKVLVPFFMNIIVKKIYE